MVVFLSKSLGIRFYWWAIISMPTQGQIVLSPHMLPLTPKDTFHPSPRSFQRGSFSYPITRKAGPQGESTPQTHLQATANIFKYSVLQRIDYRSPPQFHAISILTSNSFITLCCLYILCVFFYPTVQCYKYGAHSQKWKLGGFNVLFTLA